METAPDWTCSSRLADFTAPQHSSQAPKRLNSVFPTSPLQNIMQQLLIFFTLTVLMLAPSLCSPAVGCSVDEAISPACIPTLSDYYTQVTDLPKHLNERSLAAWTYVERIDMDRVPQVIHEAVCLARHSCNGVDSSLSVESIPISIKIPVLRRNPGCLHHSMEFESVNIACICASARRN